MNLLLIEQQQISDSSVISLKGKRLEHLRSSQQQLQVGRILKVGIINGLIGSGEVISHSEDAIELKIHCNTPPPEPLPLTLLMAIPRPKMLKRILANCAELGVKDIYLLNTWKTEKAFLQSKLLEADNINDYLKLGLEQACDTILPNVTVCPRFKPFVEDQLKDISDNSKKYVAHPGSHTPLPNQLTKATTLAIGPEAGFNDFEIALLTEQGFESVSLGSRILKVENAVSIAIAKLFY